MRLQYFAYSSLDANSAFKPSKQTKIIVFVNLKIENLKVNFCPRKCAYTILGTG